LVLKFDICILYTTVITAVLGHILPKLTKQKQNQKTEMQSFATNLQQFCNIHETFLQLYSLSLANVCFLQLY